MRGTARRRRPPGARLLRLYPATWRRRYELEMLAVLQDAPIGMAARLDLVRGAIDSRLHDPTRLPAVAALLAGGLWTVAGAGIVARPDPPAWPGYLLEALPSAILAAVLGGFAATGCWARRSDAGGRTGVVAIAVAAVGHVAWTAALIAAWLGAGAGAVTLAAQALALLGAILVGLVLMRAGDERIGTTLVVGPAVMLVGWPLAWLVHGFGLTLVGVLLLTSGSEPDQARPSAFA